MVTNVYFATNRTEPETEGGQFGDRFHKDGPHFYRVGEAEVTWPEIETPPDGGFVSDDTAFDAWDDCKVSYELEPETAPEAIEAASTPELTHKSGAGGEAGSSNLFSGLRGDPDKDEPDILVYIHGFANTFDSAMSRAAQLKEMYRIPAPADGVERKPDVFAFSWPSNGAVQPPWEYANDREDAAFSGIAMARALQRLLDFLAAQDKPCKRRLHLVAHSMGNWALRHAVQGLLTLNDGARLEKIFDNVFLMAADEDEDCFEHRDKLAALTEMARRVHVYHAADDLPMHVSDKTKFNMDRLGTDGPRSFSGLSSRITAIDCNAVSDTLFAHGRHQYYRLRKEVLADIRHVLSGRYISSPVPGRDVIEPGRRYRLTDHTP